MIAASALAALAIAVGPGAVDTNVSAGAYRVHVALTPNRARSIGRITLNVTKRGHPLEGARVRATVTMLDMNMGSFVLSIPQARLGTYTASTPIVGMSGRWGWTIVVAPRGAETFSVVLVDRMQG